MNYWMYVGIWTLIFLTSFGIAVILFNFFNYSKAKLQKKKINEAKAIIESTNNEEERIKKLSTFNINIVREAYKTAIPKKEETNDNISKETTNTATEPRRSPESNKPADTRPAKQRAFSTGTFAQHKQTDKSRRNN